MQLILTLGENTASQGVCVGTVAPAHPIFKDMRPLLVGCKHKDIHELVSAKCLDEFWLSQKSLELVTLAAFKWHEFQEDQRAYHAFIQYKEQLPAISRLFF